MLSNGQKIKHSVLLLKSMWYNSINSIIINKVLIFNDSLWFIERQMKYTQKVAPAITITQRKKKVGEVK